MLDNVAVFKYLNNKSQPIVFTETDDAYMLTNLSDSTTTIVKKDDVPYSPTLTYRLRFDVTNRKNLLKVLGHISSDISAITEIDHTCMNYFIDVLMSKEYHSSKTDLEALCYHLMLHSDPNNKSDISDFKVIRSTRWPIAESKGELYLKLWTSIENYFSREYDSYLSESDFKDNILNIYYTTFGENEEYEVNVRLDLNDMSIKTYYSAVDDEERCMDTEQYESIEDLIEYFDNLDASDIPVNYVDEYCGNV